jgi:phospho-N-acetylmuramoyl-pentapeptide-transferase
MLLPVVLSVLLPALFSFCIGFFSTPLLTHYLYHYKVWKKVGGKRAYDGDTAHEFNRLHAELETKTPRMGGIVVWGSVCITTIGLTLLAQIFPTSTFTSIDFLTRSETWIPFFTLVVGSVVGFVSDVLDIGYHGRDMRIRERLLIVCALSTFIGWWFYAKLGISVVMIPFFAPLFLGWLIIPFFVFVSLCLYASGVIDGIDGLSGGVFASIFASYAIIAFAEGQIDLAAFCACVVGGLLAFLWFNIPPARFYMSETGTMGLTLTIASIAFMTDKLGGGIGIAVLPIIGGILVVTVMSNVIQILSKRYFGKKVFRIAPLHHHFEAIGWPSYKVVMRYWILSIVLAFVGVIVALSSL